MEDRVVRALDVLAKATKASDGILLDRAAAAAESGSTSLCRPWSRRDFLARLRTFTPGRWFAKVTKREEQATCPSQSHSLTRSAWRSIGRSSRAPPSACAPLLQPEAINPLECARHGWINKVRRVNRPFVCFDPNVTDRPTACLLPA